MASAGDKRPPIEPSQGNLQQRLMQAAEKVERVLYDTHDAYARLEAQDRRLLPLQGMLGTPTEELSESRLDQFRRFIIDLRASHEEDRGDSALRQIDTNHGRAIMCGDYSGSQARGIVPADATSSHINMDPSLHHDLLSSIEVLEQEMAQLTDLAACGEHAAGEVAGVKKDLQSLCQNMGNHRPFLKDVGISSPELRGSVAALRAHVCQLSANCEQRDVDAAKTQLEVGRLKEALLALYHSLSSGSLDFIASPSCESARLADEVSLLKQELDAMRGEVHAKAEASKHEWAQPLDMGFQQKHRSNGQVGSVTSPEARFELVKEVHGLRHELADSIEDVRAGLANLADRIQRASGQAANAKDDVDSLRDEVAALSSRRLSLGASEQYVTRQEHVELRQYLGLYIEETFAGRQQETADSQKKHSQAANLKQDVEAALEELVQTCEKNEKAMEEVRDSDTKVQREVKRLWETVNIIKADKDVSEERMEACEQQVNSLGKELNDAVAELKQKDLRLSGRARSQTQDETLELMCKTLEKQIQDLKQELRSRCAHIEADMSQAMEEVKGQLLGRAVSSRGSAVDSQSEAQVPREEFKSAIEVLMEELVDVRGNVAETQKDQEKLVEGLQVLRVRNGSLAEEVKGLMGVLSNRVHNLQDELVEALAELREASGSSATSPLAGNPGAETTASPTAAKRFEERLAMDAFRQEAIKKHAALEEDVQRLVQQVENKYNAGRELAIEFDNVKVFLNKDMVSLRGEIQRAAAERVQIQLQMSDFEEKAKKAQADLADEIRRLFQQVDDKHALKEQRIPYENGGGSREMQQESLSSPGSNSVTRQDLRDAMDTVRQEVALLTGCRQDVTDINAAASYRQRKPGSSISEKAIVDVESQVEQDIVEVNEAIRKELAILRQKAADSEDIAERLAELEQKCRSEIGQLAKAPHADEVPQPAEAMEFDTQGMNPDLARLAGWIVARQATLDGRVSQELARTLEDAAVTRKNCEQLRLELTTLTARVVAERSMVVAGVAAAMNAADVNGSVDEAQISARPVPDASILSSAESTLNPARLRVTIVGAQGLGETSSREAIRPYCECSASGREWCFKTEALDRICEPAWKYTFETQAFVMGDTLEFRIWDQANHAQESVSSRRTLLGKASLSSARFFPDGFEGNLPLSEEGSENGAMFLTVCVELRGKPILERLPQEGPWTYLVLAPEGVSLHRSLVYDKEETLSQRLHEGELVTVLERRPGPGIIFLRVGSGPLPGTWVASLGTSSAAFVEVTLDHGLWSGVVAAPQGLYPLHRCSLAMPSSLLMQEEFLDKGFEFEATQRVQVKDTTFFRLRELPGWLVDRSDGVVQVDSVTDMLGEPVELTASSDAADAKMGITLTNMPPGKIPFVKNVYDDGWAARSGISPGTAILEVHGESTLMMEAQEFKYLLNKRPVKLKVRLRTGSPSTAGSPGVSISPGEFPKHRSSLF